MADHLSVCMTCGRYMKGTSHDSDELFKNHLCNASREQVKKNMLECMAILRTLDGTCAIGTIESTLPPPPPPPPRPPTPNSIQMNDVFKANFDEVHKELKLKLIGRAEKIERAQEDYLRADKKVRAAQNTGENKRRKHKEPIINQSMKRSRKH